PVHLDRLHAPRALDPLRAPQDRCGDEACWLRSRQSFRQGAGQCAGELSARRAVPDRRGPAVPLRARGALSRRAPARARAGEARSLAHDPVKAQTIFRRYRDAFPLAYREAYFPATAVGDIRVLESLSPARPLGAEFYARGRGAERAAVGLKVSSRDRPIPLSERVPVLENMGFKVLDERTYRVEPAGGGAPEGWLHDMMLDRADGAAVDVDALKQRLEAAFLVVMAGRAENDGYNALVLEAGLQWRDVALVRTISRFLRQARVAYSQD